MVDTAPRGTLGTVHNAALLLDLLATGPAHQQLTDLAERSGMSLPTLHRLLRSLVAADLVEQDPRSSRYGLGPGLVRLAERYLTRLPVLQVAGPYLVELRDRTHGTVRLCTLVDTDTVEVDRVDGDDVGGVFRDASRVRPAVRTAAGRLLLAHASDELWQRAQVGLAEGNGRLDTLPTDADRRRWRAADHLVVPAATAADHPEIAAPVRDGSGAPIAAISITGSVQRLPPEVLVDTVAPQLVRAAATISRTLGHG
jgi:IclR family transcriptional regulator, acetate operon repressor